VTERDDYFNALGVGRSFFQNPVLLQSRFYERSRALHPDRFSTASPEERGLSLERMSLVNQAYTTLKDAELRAEYLLSLEGVKAPVGPGKGQLPMDLAESWFEIQDLVMESPEAAKPKLEEFESELRRYINAEQDVLAGLEREYDRAGDRASLEAIAGRIQGKNYLKSLEKDVVRIKSRLRI
jgi:molecular chaperone HscB